MRSIYCPPKHVFSIKESHKPFWSWFVEKSVIFVTMVLKNLQKVSVENIVIFWSKINLDLIQPFDYSKKMWKKIVSNW